jgi:hypothetical protein
MSAQIKCLSIGRIRELLAQDRRDFGPSQFGAIAVCHVADLFLAAEKVRKGEDWAGPRRIREGATAVHEGVERGRVMVVQLDGFAVEKCLFAESVDGESLLDPGVASALTPEGSANALSVRLLREQWSWDVEEES